MERMRGWMRRSLLIFRWEMAGTGRLLIMVLLLAVALFSYSSGIRETGLGRATADRVASLALWNGTGDLYVLATPIIAALVTLSIALERETGLMATYLGLSANIKQLLTGKLLATLTTIIAPLAVGAAATVFLVTPQAPLTALASLASTRFLLTLLGLLFMTFFILFLCLATSLVAKRPIYSFVFPTSILYLFWYVSFTTPKIKDILPPRVLLPPNPIRYYTIWDFLEGSGPLLAYLAVAFLALLVAATFFIRSPERI